jgi:SAM-dependent methyltransferase
MTTSPSRLGGDPQSVIDRYFDEQAPYWRDVYSEEGLQGLIYRQRMAVALAWIDDIGPPSGAAVLEVGSGAGLLSVQLAERGFEVTSTDASSEMVELTSRHVERRGLSVQVRVADVHQLSLPSAGFDLVVALGVLPWLHDPPRAVAEMARVLRPGGLLVLSADNRWRLGSLVSGQNPLLKPLKVAYRALSPAPQQSQSVPSHLHSPSAVEGFVTSAGLSPVRRATLGFGPLELLGRPLLSEAAALRLHVRLQALSDRRAPILRNTGWHILEAARRRA